MYLSHFSTIIAINKFYIYYIKSYMFYCIKLKHIKTCDNLLQHDFQF